MRIKRLTISFCLLSACLLSDWPDRPNAGTRLGQNDNTIIMLNARGARARGPVRFDHQAHQGHINPAPDWPYKANATATCSGCHHTANEQGLPQLWKCTVCHQTEGKGTGQFVNKRCGQLCEPSGNPKNCQCDELYFERAFHDSCIGCHRATNAINKINRAPVTCGGCHAARQ